MNKLLWRLPPRVLALISKIVGWHLVHFTRRNARTNELEEERFYWSKNKGKDGVIHLC